MSITSKFTLAFALLLTLIMLLAITSYVALTVVQRQTETAILTSTKIQRVILQMDSNLEEARRLQRDYFMQYSTFGFSRDRHTYVRQTKERISEVISLSEELQQLIAASDVSHSLRDSQVNLNYYLSSANRYLETFNEAVELITGLTADETGLQAQLVKNSTLLLESLQYEDNHLLLDLYQNMQLHEKDYWITRQRPAMQSAFNDTGRLRQTVEEMPGIGTEQKTKIFSYLDNYLSIAEEILRFDVAVRSKFNEFELQIEALEPISIELITFAGGEVERARTQIRETGQLATGILVVISLLGLTLAIIIARLLNKDITRNVVKLTETARELQAGNLDVQAQIDSADELGQLADTFNAMTGEIKTKVVEMTKLNQTLQTSEERFREFVEGTDNIITRVSNQRLFTYVNHAALKVYGIPPEECIGLSTISFIDPRDHDRTERWFTECVRNQVAIATIENRQVSKAGEIRDMIWTVNFHYDKLGQIDHINAIGRDITERKHSEDELRHLRNYLSNIINSMPSVLVGVDSNSKVTQWNKTAEQATGVAAADAQGKTLSHVFPRLTSEMERVRKSILNRRVEHNPKVFSTINNETHYEDVTIYPLVANGVEGAVIRVDDITERVRIEEMMIQTEKMLSVGGLAAGMAHEINNPLGGIMQNAAVIARRLTEDMPANRSAAEECGTDTETIRAYMEKRGIPRMLDLVRESGSRAAGIVQNMLSFSRKSESARTNEDLAELLDKTVELASSDYDLKKKYDFRLIEIVREYDPERPKVNCEASTIQQVFLNLLKNAAEAMYGQTESAGPHPRFILRVSQDEKDKGMVCVEVEDNGPGMDEATRKRVFEPFFTTKPVGLGTGLGLSVSYFIISEHHGGTMDVESSQGKGTKFIICLPAERGKE